MVIKNFALINVSRRWEIYSNLFSKALKSGFKSYWKHWSVQGLHTPLKMLIINIAVRCTSLYLQKIKNYFKINKTRFYQKLSTSFSRPPCRGFLNHVSIHGFLAIMTCWCLFICISFILFFLQEQFCKNTETEISTWSSSKTNCNWYYTLPWFIFQNIKNVT